MQVLKKIITNFLCLIFVTGVLKAQNENQLQEAFNESYTQEYYKKYNEAITPILKVHKNENYNTCLRLGWLYYNSKNYSQSQLYYQKATTLKPYAIEARIGLLKPLTALESWDAALEQYQEIIKIDPSNYTANYWAGVILYNRKKYEAATKHFEKLVNLYPFDYDANHMLGWSYLYLARKNDAKILFNQALLIRPSDASSLEGLASIK